MAHNFLITRLPDTRWPTAFQSLMWPVDDIFVLPGVITSLCLDTVSAHMGVGHLLLPVQLPGTHRAMICVIRRLALTVSDVCLKLGCFQTTSTNSAVEVSHFMRYINSRFTYLLTYLHCVSKNGPTLKRYSSKLYRSILMIFGRNIQKALE